MGDEVLEQLYTNWTEDQDEDQNQNQNQNQDNNQNNSQSQANHNLPTFEHYNNGRQPEETRSESVGKAFDKMDIEDKEL